MKYLGKTDQEIDRTMTGTVTFDDLTFLEPGQPLNWAVNKMEYRMNDLLGGKRITNISMKQLSCHASSCNELLNLISLNLENLQFIEFEDFSDDITELDDHALY